MNVVTFESKSIESKYYACAKPGIEDVLNKNNHVQRALLLQGPVGPFFAELHAALIASGVAVRRVVFNAGDQLFALRHSCVRFSGAMHEWEAWLRFELTTSTPDVIVLFGSSRPAHEIARRIAKSFDINVISLEEGYLRSGYVSVEAGGNNQHSPFSQWRPREPLTTERVAAPAMVDLRFPFATMSVWAAAYYLVRDRFSKTTDDALFHRHREGSVPLALNWMGHMLRRFSARLIELPTRISLHRNPGYLLVPLQVASDSQLRNAAKGWTTPKLIDACLRALARSGGEQRLIFKLHPLERGSAAIKRLIRMKTAQYGLNKQRVRVLHSGYMGDLTRHSSGMVVINSTSAFSALHHNIPVLVLGEAVFRHEAIVTVGKSAGDIAAFFKLRRPKSRRMIEAFFADLKAESLVPGDFYVAAGRRAAIANILNRLQILESRAPLSREVAR